MMRDVLCWRKGKGRDKKQMEMFLKIFLGRVFHRGLAGHRTDKYHITQDKNLLQKFLGVAPQLNGLIDG